MSAAERQGRLILVATPIGNLGDLPPRAVEVFAAAALICCEDTRRTGRLLQHAAVSGVRLAICNEHTEVARAGEVIAVLGAGNDVALVTDAGTPGVSDPGERLVRAVLDAGFEVSAVPGPAAFVTALVASGLPTARFVFEGFLPRSGSARRQRIAELGHERRTVVFYEAPHRVERTVADLRAAFGDDRPVAIARELTKMYEQFVRATLGTVDLGTPRGEYVLVVGGAPDVVGDVDEEAVDRAIDAALAAGLSSKDSAAQVAVELGIGKREAYAVAVARRRATKARGE